MVALVWIVCLDVFNVTKIGHFGTGDLEGPIKTKANLTEARRPIKMAFEEIGGSAKERG